MKTKEFKDLRSKDVKSLRKVAYDTRLKMLKMSMELKTGKEKNLKLVANFKDEIAKILTLIREKEIMEKLEKGKENA